MREIPIPKPWPNLEFPLQDGTKRVIAEYTYSMFLDEYVWGQPEWRQDAEHMSAQERLMEAFDDALAAGAELFCASDLDFEKFEKLASLKGKSIAPPFVRCFTRMTRVPVRARYIKSQSPTASAAEVPAPPPVKTDA